MSSVVRMWPQGEREAWSHFTLQRTLPPTVCWEPKNEPPWGRLPKETLAGVEGPAASDGGRAENPHSPRESAFHSPSHRGCQVNLLCTSAPHSPTTVPTQDTGEFMEAAQGDKEDEEDLLLLPQHSRFHTWARMRER